ncbi:hypothetical protein ACHAXA_005097 [Cyclostephanos tholiformis]|uniref:Uncharacterized protein n=1 Tax=Cyclostephanos tholiformis TaxID=382380 RepID=A0ABD3REU3_9STRA
MLRLLYATNPGSALGGRLSPDKIPPKKLKKSTEVEAESNQSSSKEREEPVLSHVYLERNQTGVSSLGLEGDILLNSGVTIHETKREGEFSSSESNVQSYEFDLTGEVEVPVGEVELTTTANLPKLVKVQTTEQSNVAPNTSRQMFATVVANNYYNAIQQLNASKRSSFLEASKRISATKRKKSLSEVTCRDKSKTSGCNDYATMANKNDGTKKKGMNAEKMTLEQLVAKALSVAITPEEIAHYSLAKDDVKHDESNEKNLLHNAIFYKDDELSVKTEIFPSPAFDINTVKTEIVTSPAVVLPVACPPVSSFNINMIQSTLSAASSITQQSGCDENTIINEAASSGEKNAGQKSNPDRYDYPPMAKNPSPICRPDEDYLVYPEPDNEFNMVDLPGNLMLDDLAMKSPGKGNSGSLERESNFSAVEIPGVIAPKSSDKIMEPVVEESIEEVLEAYLAKSTNSTASLGKLWEDTKISSKPPLIDPITRALMVVDVLSGIGAASGMGEKSTFPRSLSPSFFKNKKIETISEDEIKLSARSMSPSLFLSHKSDAKLPSKSSSDCSTATSSTSSASSGAGPRLILLPHTCADGDVNDEKSIITFPVKNPKVKSSFKPMVPSQKDTICQSKLSTEIVEVLAPIKNETSTVACQVALTEEKPAFHQPRVPGRDEVKDTYELPEVNTINISSIVRSQNKKEKLRKIMDYRKVAEVAHPTQNLNKCTSFENSKKIKEIVIRNTECSSFSKEMPKKGRKKNVKKGDRTLKGKWSAPVQRIDVYPNALEYDDADDDVSLPPELKTGKIKIWQEDASIESGVSNGKDTSGARKGRDTMMLADSYINCGEINRNDTDIFDGIHADNNTLTGNIVNDDDESAGDEMKSGGMFTCGIETQELKDEIIFEVKDLARDIEFGVRRGLRNLFGTCDITRDGGMEYLRANVDSTNDQLFGRGSMQTASESQKSKAQTIHTQSVASNKQKLYITKLKELSLKHV